MDDFVNGNFVFDPELLKEMEENLSAGETSLPFPAPLFYAVNGQATMKASPAPALYFGGWATDKVRMDQVCTAEKRLVPGQLIEVEQSNQRGEDFVNYATRSAVVAPISIRQTWIDGDSKKRISGYVEGSRRHVQVLAVLATQNEEKRLVPWGPIVLSAKGFQAKRLLQLQEDWARHTAGARAQYAPGVPAWMFWCAVGTFGPERKAEMVGNAGKQSPITPMEVYKGEMSREKLTTLYGGESLFHAIHKYQQDSKDWREAWSKPAGMGGTARREEAPLAPVPALRGRASDYPTDDETPF